MKLYYTEFPTGSFFEDNDEAALKRTSALVVYRESDASEDGRPFIILREEVSGG